MHQIQSKIHQIQFWLGSAPDPAGIAYSAPHTPIARFKGSTSKVKGGEWEEKRRGGSESKGGEGTRGRERPQGLADTPNI